MTMTHGKRLRLGVLAIVMLLMSACENEKATMVDAPEPVLLSALPADQLSLEQGQEDTIFLSTVNDFVAVEGFPFFKENGNRFYRLRLSETDQYNAAIQAKNEQTSGGMMRFCNNSQRISLRVRNAEFEQDNNNSLLATAGLEIWVGTGGQNSCAAVICPLYGENEYQYNYQFPNADGLLFDVTIKLPSFCGIKIIEIGLRSDALIAKPAPHSMAPIVFYGSSITQGAGASRPGSTYIQLITEELDAELINFGFSSGALGEKIMAETIAILPEVAAVVIDYDYNAPDPKYLGNTHYPFYAAIRAAHPEIPIILLSRVNDAQDPYDPIEARRTVIKETYDRALAMGDKNIYFVDGSSVMGENRRDRFFIDGIHPNDIGHLKIAEALLPVLKKALKL